MDPSKYQGMRDADEAHTVGELYYYVQCMGRSLSAIPRLSERAAPLYVLLEAVSEQVGKHTNHAIKNLDLDELGWEKSHPIAFVGF